MSKEDEESFLQYLRSSGPLVILPSTSPSSDFARVSVLPEPSEDEDTRKFWLQNITVRLPLATEYAPEKNCYVIDGFQSPVVEFQRSWMVSHMMLAGGIRADRKSTRLNSSHVKISYAVFCLKKKNKIK